MSKGTFFQDIAHLKLPKKEKAARVREGFGILDTPKAVLSLLCHLFYVRCCIILNVLI